MRKYIVEKLGKFGRSVAIGLAVLTGLVVYAYGFQVTKVNLDETRSVQRQTQLVRILRALAKPDLIAFDYQEFQVDVPIMVPCPPGGFQAPEPDTNVPYLIVTPACAEPGAEVTVQGFNFEPNTQGPLSFIPPSEVKLQIGQIQADSNGRFQLTAKLPKRDSEEVQHIRAVTRLRVGGPRLSQTAIDTWNRIVETVFMALLATTLGTILAVPLSFFAARNLMRDVKSPLITISLNILAIPVGLWLGATIARWVGDLSQAITNEMALVAAGVVLGLLVVAGILRWALPAEDEAVRPPLGLRVLRLGALAIAVLVAILSLFLISTLAIKAGDSLALRLGSFGFLGTFVSDLGDILDMSLVLLNALAAAGSISNFAGKGGRWLTTWVPPAPGRFLQAVLAILAGAVLGALIGAGIDWFYQLADPLATLWIPAGVGAAGGLILAIRYRLDDAVPVGMVVYYGARTIFNALRSIEALIMVIVFVVWVGIGPFAGILALSLHTVASLAKLYSEQVESILPGPIEAISATGANRIQTIVYGVIPQIIPPFISFTMYRWDINVRMSTIIGFAGGGGIGFLLIQNINLLNYRAASAQMLAIAIVVATMDYLSSQMREKVV